MRPEAIFHPDFSPEPYWWEAAPPATEGAGELPARCEVLVVGSEYAGLKAALELARSGCDVCVVEANAFGSGASSRNGGAVSAGVNLGKGISGSPGQKGADARSKAMLGALNRITGSAARLVHRDEQRREIGSDYYFGGMVLERSGKLHPALYQRGLLGACRRHAVALVANTAVSGVTGGEGEFRVRTTRGDCRVEQVVIATNGYTGNLCPNLRRRIVPVASHIIATEELPADLARGLAPTGRTLSETPRILHYYRTSPEGRRMIFGGRARFTTSSPEVTAPILHAAMLARYPQLEGYRVTHCWSPSPSTSCRTSGSSAACTTAWAATAAGSPC